MLHEKKLELAAGEKIIVEQKIMLEEITGIIEKVVMISFVSLFITFL